MFLVDLLSISAMPPTPSPTPISNLRWFADARRFMAQVVGEGPQHEDEEPGDGLFSPHRRTRRHHGHHGHRHSHTSSPHGSRTHGRRRSSHHDGIIGGGLMIVDAAEDGLCGPRHGDTAMMSPRAMMLACRAAMDQVRVHASGCVCVAVHDAVAHGPS